MARVFRWSDTSASRVAKGSAGVVMKSALAVSLLVFAVGCSAGSSVSVDLADGAADGVPVGTGSTGKTPKPEAGAHASTTRGTGGNPDAGHDATTRACVPGQESRCTCAGGASGIEVCAASGAGYGAC